MEDEERWQQWGEATREACRRFLAARREALGDYAPPDGPADVLTFRLTAPGHETETVADWLARTFHGTGTPRRVLVGGPGAGKTEVLLRAALATEGTERIPFFLRLTDFGDDLVFDYGTRSDLPWWEKGMFERGASLPFDPEGRQSLLRLLQSSRSLLLFDEIPSDSFTRYILEIHQKCAVSAVLAVRDVPENSPLAEWPRSAVQWAGGASVGGDPDAWKADLLALNLSRYLNTRGVAHGDRLTSPLPGGPRPGLYAALWEHLAAREAETTTPLDLPDGYFGAALCHSLFCAQPFTYPSRRFTPLVFSHRAGEPPGASTLRGLHEAADTLAPAQNADVYAFYHQALRRYAAAALLGMLVNARDRGADLGWLDAWVPQFNKPDDWDAHRGDLSTLRCPLCAARLATFPMAVCQAHEGEQIALLTHRLSRTAERGLITFLRQGLNGHISEIWQHATQVRTGLCLLIAESPNDYGGVLREILLDARSTEKNLGLKALASSNHPANREAAAAFYAEIVVRRGEKPDDRRGAAMDLHKLRAVPEDAVLRESLFRIVSNPTERPDTLRAVLDALGEGLQGDENGIRYWTKQMENGQNNPGLRQNAAYLLTRAAVGNRETITQCLTWLENPETDTDLHLRATQILGKIAVGDAEATERCLKWLRRRNQDPTVRRRVLVALGLMTRADPVMAERIRKMWERL